MTPHTLTKTNDVVWSGGIAYWVCPRCKIMWPLNAHGFAVTCACNDGTADATRPGDLLRAGKK